MLFKLSLKNIRKSIKDYSIYFFTLVFAVAMFYMFNSVDAQESMLELTNSKKDLIDALVYVIGYISVFVSVVLGFLIVYSNNFLIRKRKKEIGLYLTLGMSKRKVSTILVIETILIGLVSLVVGLILGIFLSQFISILTARLFEVNMTDFKFIFSSTALSKTLIYFGIIFVCVAIFNVLTLSRYKLIDLLIASRKNEKVKFRNKYIIIISFILSITLIGYAYNLLFNGAMLMMDKSTGRMIITGALGTFLLFFSLSGFLVKLIQKFKNIYYKNLNMFTLKQINSRINTTVISTTIISLMLLLTIGILSGSMSLASVFNNDLKENNLTDYTVSIFLTNWVHQEDGTYIRVPFENRRIEDIKSAVNSDSFKEYSKENVLYTEYFTEDLKFEDLVLESDMKDLRSEYGNALSTDYEMPIMSFTDYKNLMTLFGREVVPIKDNEYLVLANMDIIVDTLTPYHSSKKGIDINGKHLIPANDVIIDTAIENYNSSGNTGIIVVSDELTNELDASLINIVGNYVDTDDVEELENSFINYIYSDNNIFDMGGISVRTKIDMEASSIGVKALLIFIGLYLGITFAITSATILAIGELSSASDNKNRYKVLRELGADNKMLNHSLLTQISITFLFPLVIALIHSYFGLREINNLVIVFSNIDLTSNIILTTLFMIIVYGGYLFVTYMCSKNLIKK